MKTEHPLYELLQSLTQEQTTGSDIMTQPGIGGAHDFTQLRHFATVCFLPAEAQLKHVE